MIRSSGQVLYDHNHEDITATLHLRNTTVAYRRNERVLKILFILQTFIIWIPFQLAIESAFVFRWGTPIVNSVVIIALIYYGIFFILMILTFIYIYTLMKGLQNYQFNENKKQMMTIFICILICFATKLVIYEFQLQYSDIQGLIIVQFRHQNFCESVSSTIKNISGLITFINDFKLISIALAWIIIKYKSSDDIIEGISKLDNILVSVFQKMKIQESINETPGDSDSSDELDFDHLSKEESTALYNLGN